MVEVVAGKDEDDEDVCDGDEGCEDGENDEIGDLKVEAGRGEDGRKGPVGRVVLRPGKSERA